MSDDSQNAPKPAKMRTSLRVVFFASLALNILVIGALAGAVLRPDGGGVRRADRGPAFEAGLGPFGAALGKEQREALGLDIRSRSKERAREMEQLRTDFARMLDLLRAAEFQPDALREQFRATQMQLNAQQQIGVDALIAQLEGMSSAERADFADRVENTLRRMARRRK